MKEKITIPFYNDLLFKYFVYDNEDEGCQYILKKIIEEITPIRCKELYVINSELMTHHYREKRSILDVRVKTQEGEYINIHEQVVLNILNFKGQELLLNRVLRASIESPAYNASAYWIYNVLLWSNIVKSGKENGGKIAMNRLAVMNSGYSLRTALLASKGAKDDECIRGTLYQLMNALSTKNTGKYLEIVMRLYSSCKIPANEEQAGKLVVPSAFVNMFNNPALFEEYGYAFLLGLKGCNSNSKKQDNKND